MGVLGSFNKQARGPGLECWGLLYTVQHKAQFSMTVGDLPKRAQIVTTPLIVRFWLTCIVIDYERGSWGTHSAMPVLYEETGLLWDGERMWGLPRRIGWIN